MAHLRDDAFEQYAALGASRTYEALARQLGVSKRTVVRRAKAEHWQDRLAQVERDARAKAEARLTESFAAVTERHLRTLRAVQHKALQALTGSPMGTAAQAAATLIAAVRAERAIVAPQGTEGPAAATHAQLCAAAAQLPEELVQAAAEAMRKAEEAKTKPPLAEPVLPPSLAPVFPPAPPQVLAPRVVIAN